MAANSGLTASSEVDADDLCVDMAAFLTVKAKAADLSRLIADVIRTTFLSIEDEPGYLAKQFSAQWFGSRTTTVNAAKSMFTQPWPWDAAISFWLQGRPPGGTIGSLDPSPAVRATELQNLGEGFADAVDNAKVWTSY